MEEAGGEGNAALVEEASPGRGCQVGGGCRWQGTDDEVEIVRWRWRGGTNPRIMCEEWLHSGSIKIYVLANRATQYFFRKGSVFANRARHYNY